MTPYYGFEEDVVHFHQTCRDALVSFGDGLYPRFKTEGGFDRCFAIARSVGDYFLDAYAARALVSNWGARRIDHGLDAASSRLEIFMDTGTGLSRGSNTVVFVIISFYSRFLACRAKRDRKGSPDPAENRAPLHARSQ